MLNWLVSTSLRLRLVVICLACLLLIVGGQMVSDTPLDVFPEFAPPLVEIQTEAPGLSTPEVESLVTVPIENAVKGVSWLQTLRSKSVLGLSSIVLIFEQGTDLMRARQLVQERLATLSAQLPTIARAPVILPPLSATSRVLKIGLSSSTLSQMELSTLARWTIRPRLMAVPGVANVAIWGQRDRQLQILVDPRNLLAHDVTLDQIVRVTQDAVTVASGGYVDTPTQRLAVAHHPAVSAPEDLAMIPVAFENGAPLLLGSVATVVEGFPPPIGDAIINDGPGILLIVEKQPTGNTLDVTREVEAALDAMRPGLRDVEIDSTIFRPATFIEISLTNLTRAFLVGALLVVLVLAVFLYDWRTALVSVLAIPVSLLTAVLVLQYFGATINTMILAGLVIALGEVVDDAIIDVENIERRLRLNRTAQSPRSSFRVVLRASLEVRSAIVFATLIIVLVFVPVFFLPGLSGSFFRPLALAYVLAVLASLLVALTLTPALSLILLPRGTRSVESPVVGILKRGYRALLPAVVSRPRGVVVLLVLILTITLCAVPYLGEEFLPDFQEYDFLMHWVGKPGTSLEAMRRITMRASQELRSLDGVRNFGAHIGRAEVADEVVGPEFTELWISLEPDVDYPVAVREIQQVVDGYPGLYRDLLTYLRERIKEVLTGTPATVVVRIYGPTLEVLRQKAQEVADRIASVEGVIDLRVEPQVLVPMIAIEYKHEVAQRLGVTPGDVRNAAATLVQGKKVGEIYQDQQITDVVVRGVDRLRSDLQSLQSIRIDGASGVSVPLRDVADVSIIPSPNSIQREGASRRIDVTMNVRGNDLGSVAQAIEREVLGVEFQQGYFPEFIGEYAEREAARKRLAALGALSILGIFLLLHTDFKSVRLALLVLVSLPFALVGGVMASFLGSGVLSLGSLVGFVTVLGIAARNGIMMVSHFRHLETEEGVPFGRDLVLRGAEERLAPILMTAATTALALLPIAVGGSRPGYEIEHPMAVVIIGGLVTSTLLNLFFMPSLYHRFGRPGG